jgi:DNA invertase Pin-like site-specific DNA recombinase
MQKDAVAYVRISQEDENPMNQLSVIQQYADNNGFKIKAVFKDIGVSGTIPPRQRQGYTAMLKYMQDNNIKNIIIYDLSRLSRNVIQGLEELKQLAEEGYNVYFASMDFLNYIEDPMLKKKILMDFLWFAEMYVADIKKRTKTALERLKKEGKLYHRPSLLHKIAMYLTGKTTRELTRQDIENAERYLYNYITHQIIQGKPIKQIWKQFTKQHGIKTSYITFLRTWSKIKRRKLYK